MQEPVWFDSAAHYPPQWCWRSLGGDVTHGNGMLENVANNKNARLSCEGLTDTEGGVGGGPTAGWGTGRVV